MADELLRTKLMPPPGHVDLIERDRVRPLLITGLRLPLTLVVAPAGAGKTSLVRSWRSGKAGASASLAWVSLDENDNDSVRFWRYVIAAIETVAPGSGEAARSYLDSSPGATIQPALISCINRLAESTETIVLALDDYHLIESARIHEDLTFFIENLPASLRLLLLSRADPPLPLARWRARGLLAEIRNADLRFTEAEASALLTSELDSLLNREQIAALHARTEGWAAGLHLAALALRGRDNTDDFLRSFTGSHHFVLTYLIEDVFERLPEDVQEFLLKTSMLTHLSGPLCDAVTGGQGGAETLRELASINLFTMPLDDTGTWYRYHQLFAGVLQHQMAARDRSAITGLHARASDWYEQQGFTTQAIDHALLASDADRAARLIRAAARVTLSRGEARLLRRWLDAIPPEVMRQNTRLVLAGAWSQLFTGPVSDVESWILSAEQAMLQDPQMNADAFRGEVAALRTIVNSFQGKTDDTIAQAQIARQFLPEQDFMLRGLVAMSLGQAYRFNGDGSEAENAYREAVDMGLKSDNLFVAIDSMADLGVVLMRQGKLREAYSMLERADRVVRERNASHLPAAGAVATIWPEILYEMHDAEASLELAARGLELGQQGAKTDLIVNGHRSLGTAYWTLRDWDRALEENQRSADVSRAYGLVHTTRVTEARIAHIHFTRGNLDAAQQWAASYRPDPDLPGFAREVEELMLARVCIASGDPMSGLSILERLDQPARAGGQIRSVMVILNLQAVAHLALGDLEAALANLSESLSYAAPEGFIQIFLNEGPLMTRLLQHAADRGIHPTFVRQLLELSDDVPSRQGPTQASGSLVEPLSEREQAVLRLMVAGLNAPAIANELYVAASTVRTHLKNIYRKLDVHSRDQAIARARELDLV